MLTALVVIAVWQGFIILVLATGTYIAARQGLLTLRVARPAKTKTAEVTK